MSKESRSSRPGLLRHLGLIFIDNRNDVIQLNESPQVRRKENRAETEKLHCE